MYSLWYQVLWMTLQVLVYCHCARDILDENFFTFPDNVPLQDGQHFDYIVVGAGAGGATVAARLTLAGHEVLLIEAGGDPNVLTRIPSAAMVLLGSSMDWQYRTISNNKSCLSSEGRQCRFSRGKCLGGSTSMNYMLHTRGNRRRDFEDIPFTGWTFSDLMPYFLRYEGLKDLSLLPSSSIPYHNTTGPMRVGFFDDPQNNLQYELMNSYGSLQFPYNNDVNAESQIGVSKVIGFVYRGERMSTARGYLLNKDVKRKLKLAKNTMCSGVIINEKNVALGVTIIRGSTTLKLYSRKEVILSAGVIGTPQILMLSGIGPAGHLNAMSIPVKVDLPVGEGMSDHVLPLMIVQVSKNEQIFKELRLLVNKALDLGELLVHRQGSLASNGLTDVTVFANTYCYDYERHRVMNESRNGSDCEVPNIQIIHSYVERYLTTLVKPIFKQATGFSDDVIDQISAANEKYALIIVSPVLLEPRSKGSVASSDPLSPPAIFPNYLSDERDVDELVRAIRIVEDLTRTLTMKQRKASLLHLNLPGCPRYEDGALEYWRCYVRYMTYSVYHAAGTVSLGKVLDERLRVRGAHRLRVADLSVLPRPPRANTAAVTMAIGERLVDFLRDGKINM